MGLFIGGFILGYSYEIGTHLDGEVRRLRLAGGMHPDDIKMELDPLVKLNLLSQTKLDMLYSVIDEYSGDANV